MKLLLLMNPSSCGGSGKKLWNRLFSALDEKGLEYQKHILFNIEEAFELARTASGVDIIAAVGGDGTINAVASGVLENPDQEIKFAVLYTGTSPDFCRFHDIPTEPEKAVELLSVGPSREIPVLRANGEPFFCSCNPGMGAEVAAGANKLRPLFGDWFGTLLSLCKALLRNRKWDFQLNGTETLSRCNHLLFTRMPYIAGGIKIELPDLKDDEYVLWYLQDLSRSGWLKILPKLYHGGAGGTLKIVKGTTLLECQKDCPLEFDGDPHGELPLKINFSPRKLKLICGKKDKSL